MLPNVIILTGGISGSSVLAGLISRAGYWLGHDTKKVAYDTSENRKLVDLNIQIFRQTGFLTRDIADLPPPSVKKIGNLYKNTPLSRYTEFVQECNSHQPWLWKDPRLCYTVYFWHRLLDLKDIKFLVMSRDLKQTWTGLILRGKFPISLDSITQIHNDCSHSCHEFLSQERVEYLALTFEELILTPEKCIENINCLIGSNLDISDMKAIYRGPLYRVRWSKADFLKAKMKFLYYKYILRGIIRFPRATKT